MSALKANQTIVSESSISSITSLLRNLQLSSSGHPWPRHHNRTGGRQIVGREARTSIQSRLSGFLPETCSGTGAIRPSRRYAFGLHGRRFDSQRYRAPVFQRRGVEIGTGTKEAGRARETPERWKLEPVSVVGFSCRLSVDSTQIGPTAGRRKKRPGRHDR